MRRGLTLVEILVVIFIFLLVLAALYAGFISLFKSYVKGTTSTALEMSSQVALDVLRQDIEHAGYGLALDEPSLPLEVKLDSSGYTLFIRSTYNVTNDQTRGWALVRCIAGNLPVQEAPDVSLPSSKVVYLDSNGNSVENSSLGVDLFDFDKDTCPVSDYLIAYPVPEKVSGTPVCSKQFCVEISYYLAPTSSKNPACPSLLSLKRNVRWNSGRGSTIPVVDCVADFQVRYNWNGSLVDPAKDTVVKKATPDELRENLRIVYIYLLVRQGKYEPDYTFTGNTEIDGVKLKLPSDPKSLHYRWKVLKIAVEPMNLRK